MSNSLILQERDNTILISEITSLAIEILTIMNGSRYLYRSKLMGTIYLCEYHLELEQVSGLYQRMSSGPVDTQMLTKIEASVKTMGWVMDISRNAEHPDIRYKRLGNTYRQNRLFNKIWGEKAGHIESIAKMMKPMDWEQTKLITTIYAAWNDLILEDESFTDRNIISNAMNGWPSEKRKIPKRYWYSVLAWLRSKELVPRGYGYQTIKETPINEHRQTG